MSLCLPQPKHSNLVQDRCPNLRIPHLSMTLHSVTYGRLHTGATYHVKMSRDVKGCLVDFGHHYGVAVFAYTSMTCADYVT